MSEEKLNIFYELINGFEIVGTLTDDGKKLIKDGVQYLQQENQQLKEIEKEHQKINGELREENNLLKHRLETTNDFIESRKENMIPEHYDDLKYIINECDLNSSW